MLLKLLATSKFSFSAITKSLQPQDLRYLSFSSLSIYHFCLTFDVFSTVNTTIFCLLQKLLGLEELDLSDNIISSLQEVKRLRKMPLLTKLWLTGNPVTFLATYRKQTLLYFYKILDVLICYRKYNHNSFKRQQTFSLMLLLWFRNLFQTVMLSQLLKLFGLRGK